MCVCVCARVWAQCVPRRGPLGLLTRTGTAAMHCTSVESDTRFILIRKRLAPKRRERIVTVRCVVSQKTAYIVFERRHFSCTRYLTTCAVGKEVFWESRCVTQGLCITLRGVPSIWLRYAVWVPPLAVTPTRYRWLLLIRLVLLRSSKHQIGEARWRLKH